MERLKVGVIGAGSRARAHFATLPKLSDRFEVVAVCDIDPARASEAAAIFKARAYQDVEEMLGSEKLDVGFIAVQAEGHHVIAKALAEAKVHILTETPIAITLACARQMIGKARDNGVYLEVSENVPRWPHERLKQIIERSGMMGEVKSFYLSYTSGSYHGFAGVRSIIRSEPLSARCEFPDEETGVLERAEMKFERDISGIYEYNRKRGNYWRITGTKASLDGGELVIGERRLKIKTETVERDGRKYVVRSYVETDPPLVWENPLRDYPLSDTDDVARAEAWVSLYEAVVNGKPLTYGPENAARDVEILMGIRDSASRGAEITFPIRDLTEHEREIHSRFAERYGIDLLEMTPEHLRMKYSLPGDLREMMYYGRAVRSS
ncbi:TPA: Gfo/Idh/MocA family oxidoreductase [Candidatus Poribacteria bacterium]|nr:Gfo/Idh/MocA family oxidoreductase [Candidatus Poribacteria bacterium]